MRWAVITGAGSGIGSATALEFSISFPSVSLILLGRNEQKLAQTRDRIFSRSTFTNAIEILPLDLSESSSIQNAGRLIQEMTRAGTLRHIVNNAALYHTDSHTHLPGEDVWSQMMRVNFLGTVEFTNALLPVLGFGGSIVNVASTLGIRPIRNTLAYSASKAALINWTMGLALELAPRSVRVNAVCPGIVETPIHPFYHEPAEQRRAEVQARAGAQPLGRIGQPEEIARAIRFVASDESSWTTGTMMTVDGGIQLNS